MQSDEAEQLEALRNALTVTHSGINRLDELVLAVEERERAAMAAVEKEFGALAERLEERKAVLLESIGKVAEDKNGSLGAQSTALRAIAAEYEEALHEFNSILAKNQKLRKNAISKRQAKLQKLVQNALNRHGEVERLMVPKCTPFVGFQCNITPIVLEVNSKRKI